MLQNSDFISYFTRLIACVLRRLKNRVRSGASGLRSAKSVGCDWVPLTEEENSEDRNEHSHLVEMESIE